MRLWLGVVDQDLLAAGSRHDVARNPSPAAVSRSISAREVGDDQVDAVAAGGVGVLGVARAPEQLRA